jgi:hypothetical protein
MPALAWQRPILLDCQLRPSAHPPSTTLQPTPASSGVGGASRTTHKRASRDSRSPAAKGLWRSTSRAIAARARAARVGMPFYCSGSAGAAVCPDDRPADEPFARPQSASSGCESIPVRLKIHSKYTQRRAAAAPAGVRQCELRGENGHSHMGPALDFTPARPRAPAPEGSRAFMRCKTPSTSPSHASLSTVKSSPPRPRGAGVRWIQQARPRAGFECSTLHFSMDLLFIRPLQLHQRPQSHQCAHLPQAH